MTTKTVRVSIDGDRCVCAGICVVLAPSSFDIDDSGQTTVLDPVGDELEVLRRAECECPVQAIAVAVQDDEV